MLMSRKPTPRSNSSSSLSSNGSTSTVNGDRKRPARGYMWPGMSKSEPMTGLSNGRAQPVSVPYHPSAASSMSALQGDANGERFESRPLLCLTPLNGTFERKNLQVPSYPEVIRIGRQTNAKSAPTPINGYFDSKVLSRQHAEVWADAKGKIWIRDIKSSNGTFVNGQRLSGENKDSDPHELREQDMLELGIDIVSEDQKTVVHHKVAARVEYAGFATGQNLEVFNLGHELDNSNMANQLVRRNSGSQHSMRNGAPSTSYQRAQQPFLLGPVNIEQVIKKLGVSLAKHCTVKTNISGGIQTCKTTTT
jgi:pSer/pThr/pTyr-binding forkhead associated (FHA) protein